MTTLEIITLDVDQVKESYSTRSDVYNGKRVIIERLGYLNMIIVSVKGFPAKEFNINASTEDIVSYINDTTRS